MDAPIKNSLVATDLAYLAQVNVTELTTALMDPTNKIASHRTFKFAAIMNLNVMMVNALKAVVNAMEPTIAETDPMKGTVVSYLLFLFTKHQSLAL